MTGVRARWAAVLGAKGARAPVAAIVEGLRSAGVRVAGIAQDPILAEGLRTGHRVRRLTTDESVPLAATSASALATTTESFCGFHFDGGAFAAARAWIASDIAGADVVVIDEVSKLEVAGRGHAASVVDALAAEVLVVLVVRADQLFYAVERFALDEPVATLEVGAGVAPFVATVAARVGARPA